MNDLVTSVTANSAGQLEQARSIYYYVGSHFTCTDYDAAFVGTSSLREVFEKNSGTSAGINMLMLAMLRKMHIVADPVLLSTREHGYSFINYPIQERLNYNIVRAAIGGKVYFLDAAHPRLGFGQLADNCYNGHARIISKQDSGFVYFNADSLKEAKTTMVIMTNGEKGGLEGSYQSSLGSQVSPIIREKR